MATPFDVRTASDERRDNASAVNYLRSAMARDVSNPAVEWTPRADGSSRSASVAIAAGGGAAIGDDTGDEEDEDTANRALSNLMDVAINKALEWRSGGLGGDTIGALAAGSYGLGAYRGVLHPGGFRMVMADSGDALQLSYGTERVELGRNYLGTRNTVSRGDPPVRTLVARTIFNFGGPHIEVRDDITWRHTTAGGTAIDGAPDDASIGIGQKDRDLFLKVGRTEDQFHFQSGGVTQATLRNQSIEIGTKAAVQDPHDNGVIARSGNTLEVKVNGHIIDLAELAPLVTADAYGGQRSRLRFLHANARSDVTIGNLENRLGNTYGALGIVVIGSGLNHSDFSNIYLAFRGSRYWALVRFSGSLNPTVGWTAPETPYRGGPFRRVPMRQSSTTTPSPADVTAAVGTAVNHPFVQENSTIAVPGPTARLPSFSFSRERGRAGSRNYADIMQLPLHSGSFQAGPIPIYDTIPVDDVTVWLPNTPAYTSSTPTPLTHAYLEGIATASTSGASQADGDGYAVLDYRGNTRSTNTNTSRLYVKVNGRWRYITFLYRRRF